MGRRVSSLTFRDIAGSSKALRDANLLHSQGRLSEAEQRYQIVLAADGRNFDALYRLGLIRLQQARFGTAADLFRHRFAVRLVAVSDPYLGARHGECCGDRRTDARCAAGDERGFIFQVKHGKFFQRWFEKVFSNWFSVLR